jgi:CheY-like chemotaxis protein
MPKTLLLADDSVTIQKVVGITFANEDVELITVDNGDAALKRARAVRPDLILADVSMPGLNGYELCRAIKQERDLAHIPVLLLTGAFESFDGRRAADAGADAHISKPFEAQALIDQVNTLLTRPAGRPARAEIRPPAPPAAGQSPAARPAPGAPAPAARRAARPAPAAPAPAPAPAPSEPEALDSDFQFDLSEIEEAPEMEAPLAPEPRREPLRAPTPRPEPRTPSRTEYPPEPPTEFARPFAAAHQTAPLAAEDEDSGEQALDFSGFLDPLEEPAPAAEPETASTPVDDSFGRLPPRPVRPPESLWASPGPTEHLSVDPDESIAVSEIAMTPDDELPWVEPIGLEEVEDAEVAAEEVSAVTEPVVAAEGERAEPSYGLGETEAIAAERADDDSGSSLAAIAPALRRAKPQASMPAPTLDPDALSQALEKVAWEAFGALSEQVVREVVQKVEEIAWEVIPRLAEDLIREEIARLKAAARED